MLPHEGVQRKNHDGQTWRCTPLDRMFATQTYRDPWEYHFPPRPEFPDMTHSDAQLEAELAHVFAPLDKRALGLAMGLVGAALLSLMTLVSMIADPNGEFPLGLLGQFFYGYSVSVGGLVIGAAWAFITGFVWGWFLAICRNFVLALWLMVVRVRSDLSATRGFLDHM